MHRLFSGIYPNGKGYWIKLLCAKWLDLLGRWGYTPHYWAVVTIDGIEYVFDPQVEDNIAKEGSLVIIVLLKLTQKYRINILNKK